MKLTLFKRDLPKPPPLIIRPWLCHSIIIYYTHIYYYYYYVWIHTVCVVAWLVYRVETFVVIMRSSRARLFGPTGLPALYVRRDASTSPSRSAAGHTCRVHHHHRESVDLIFPKIPNQSRAINYVCSICIYYTRPMCTHIVHCPRDVIGNTIGGKKKKRYSYIIIR